MAGNASPTIGILALQGDVREHHTMLLELGVQVREIRKPSELEGIAGLVIPGGESSVMDKLVRIFGLQEPLRALVRAGLPVMGTCAGLIMLAADLEDGLPGQETIGGLDVTVRRNAFGSQVESCEADVVLEGIQGPPLHVAFIRAPLVTRVGASVRVIASLADGAVVGVEEGDVIGVAFHPEITGDDRLHRVFVDKVRARNFHAPILQTA